MLCKDQSADKTLPVRAIPCTGPARRSLCSVRYRRCPARLSCALHGSGSAKQSPGSARPRPCPGETLSARGFAQITLFPDQCLPCPGLFVSGLGFPLHHRDSARPSICSAKALLKPASARSSFCRSQALSRPGSVSPAQDVSCPVQAVPSLAKALPIRSRLCPEHAQPVPSASRPSPCPSQTGN
jgi:hypothetical protein